FDSFGARSMCTYVKAGGLDIVIDPGVALGPSRYGLPPHPLEVTRELELWDNIKRYVLESQLVIITHYHYDHHNPEEVEIFKGKDLILKHPKKNINRSQRMRSAYFIERLGGLPNSIDFGDGKSYEIGKCEILISKPVFHGTNSKLGYVIEVCIDDGKERFLFSSDVEGPSQDDQVSFMIECNPDIVFIDGPMTYMLGYRYSKKALEASLKNLTSLIEKTDVKEMILDHHLTRDLNWKERVRRVSDFGEEHGVRVHSAASFIGRKEELLEAMRKKLYEMSEKKD
ncbi:MAG: hypothetical protein J7L50_00965, partial [Candidatus Odinarchaeota archaeon]|nr:hypothetical protein [Candidatus Odinarchaeota archaeon]